MAIPQPAVDPLGFQRLAAQNLANRELDIREQDAAQRGRLLDLHIGQAERKEQSELAELARKQRIRQGLSAAITNIPEGGNRFTASYNFLSSSGLNDEVNNLVKNELDQLEQIEKIDPLAADQRFNETVGAVQGLRAISATDNQGKILNLQDTTTGDVKAYRDTPSGLVEIEGLRIPGGPEADKKFGNEKDLRKEFVDQSGEFIKSRDALSRVREAGRDPSAAGDLALIFNFMKVLDPGSVVRESEFQTAAAAKAALQEEARKGKEVPNFVMGAVNRLLTGERLLADQRNDFVNRAEKLFTPIQQTHQSREAQYRALAQRNNLAPENVVLDLSIADLEETSQKEPEQSTQQSSGIKFLGFE